MDDKDALCNYLIRAVFNKSHGKWQMLRPTNPNPIWSKTDPPPVRVHLQKVKKIAAQGTEFCMPVVDNDSQTYLIKHASQIERVFGGLHNE